ncbi:hypothetical protein QG5_1613, partial [Clostridioides difficile CD170]
IFVYIKDSKDELCKTRFIYSNCIEKFIVNACILLEKIVWRYSINIKNNIGDKGVL